MSLNLKNIPKFFSHFFASVHVVGTLEITIAMVTIINQRTSSSAAVQTERQASSYVHRLDVSSRQYLHETDHQSPLHSMSRQTKQQSDKAMSTSTPKYKQEAILIKSSKFPSFTHKVALDAKMF